MSSLAQRIEELEVDVRSGRARQVARELAKINTKTTPRSLRLKLANLCRRVGLFHLGLRFLLPLVRSKAATPSELAEYGMLLLRSDLMVEAWKTLSAVDSKAAPETLLFKAFHHFREWRDPDAIPLLESYLEASLEPYQRVVGQLNLAAAYVGSDRLDAGAELVRELTALTREKGFTRILGNCHELTAQIEIKRGRFGAARQAIEESAKELSMMGTSDELYMQKWKAVLIAKESGSIEALRTFRDEAAKRREWESVRDADRQSLRLAYDEELHLRLMFGTPQGRYREIIAAETGHHLRHSTLVLGRGPCLDLETGEFDGRTLFKPGSQTHVLVSTLMKDFYRPSRLGTLFTELHGDNFFDVTSSPDRIYQVLRRARRLFESEGVPFEIRELNGDFSLIPTASASVSIPFEKSRPKATRLQVQRLVEAFGEAQFDAPTAREKLSMSRSSFQRLVKEALEENLLIKIGDRNSTRYKSA